MILEETFSGNRIEKEEPSYHVYSGFSFAELCSQLEPIRYLIDGYIQEEALHLDYGESGSGKTFTVLDQAISIACDEIDNWCGQKIRHTPVVYFAGEGTRGLCKRCALWAQEHSVRLESVQMILFDEVFKLDDDSDIQHSIQTTITNIKERCLKIRCPNPGLIIMDTLHRYMNGDENKAVDIAKFIHACALLMREFHCAVKIITHVGNALDSKGRPRGSSSLIAAVDIATLYSKNGEGSTINVDQTKHKDGICKKGMRLTLKQGTLPPSWNDDYGNPTTSCTIELAPGSTHNEPYKTEPKPQKKMKKLQIRARNSFKEAAKKYGIIIHDEETGNDLAAVYIEDWRNISYDMSSSDNNGTKKSNFSRERTQLFVDDKILLRRIIEGKEYYCLDLKECEEEGLTEEIILGIQSRHIHRSVA